jgi:hypothetical protein
MASERFGRRNSDWMKLKLGDRVRERDGRHEGTVEMIRWGYEAKVKWENGWISDMQLRDLERIKVRIR